MVQKKTFTLSAGKARFLIDHEIAGHVIVGVYDHQWRDKNPDCMMIKHNGTIELIASTPLKSDWTAVVIG